MKKTTAVVAVTLVSCFSICQARDYFTEEFLGGDSLDLENLSLTFTPSSSIDKYTVSAERISELPTNPQGHQTIFFRDDTYKVINLGGSSVILYGQSYQKFYISSNGFITFDAPPPSDYRGYGGDVNYHFSVPQISTFSIDLDPSKQGIIKWWRETDRVVVSFLGVTVWSHDNSVITTNTFQTEMFYDGRIRLSWLKLDAWYSVVGLSDGGGKPENYEFSDLSSYETDSDKDGIPDKWETKYFENSANCSADDDSDGDGLTNQEEYICGTHPLEVSSVFAVTCQSTQQNDKKKIVLRWSAVEGRKYTVRSSDTLFGNFKIVQSDIAYPENSYITTVYQAETRFYKVEATLIN
jgi:hypothetical protein